MDNIKMVLREIRWMTLIDIAEDKDQWRTLVNMIVNFRVP
jgi:hypothetical protein